MEWGGDAHLASVLVIQSAGEAVKMEGETQGAADPQVPIAGRGLRVESVVSVA